MLKTYDFDLFIPYWWWS